MLSVLLQFRSCFLKTLHTGLLAVFITMRLVFTWKTYFSNWQAITAKLNSFTLHLCKHCFPNLSISCQDLIMSSLWTLVVFPTYVLCLWKMRVFASMSCSYYALSFWDITGKISRHRCFCIYLLTVFFSLSSTVCFIIPVEGMNEWMTSHNFEFDVTNFCPLHWCCIHML